MRSDLTSASAPPRRRWRDRLLLWGTALAIAISIGILAGVTGVAESHPNIARPALALIVLLVILGNWRQKRAGLRR